MLIAIMIRREVRKEPEELGFHRPTIMIRREVRKEPEELGFHRWTMEMSKKGCR
jgi:hypothetical protein